MGADKDRAVLVFLITAHAFVQLIMLCTIKIYGEHFKSFSFVKITRVELKVRR